MLRPCIAIGGDHVGHLGGGPGHQVVIERLGRDAVEGGHPPGAPSSAHPGVVVDGDEQDDGRGDLAGLPPDAVDLLGQALESGAVLGGAQEEGHPPVGQRGRPAQGGLRGAADPHGHGCRGGQLAVASGATGLEVAGRRARAAVPRPAELLDAGVELGAAGVEGRAGLLVLAHVAAHPDAEDDAAPRQGLQRGGLLGHDRGLAQGELDHARPQERPVGCGGGDGEDDHALEARPVPEQVVTGPQCAGTQLLGAAADGGDLGDGASTGPAGGLRPRGHRVLGEGRQDESDRPQGSCRSHHGHNAW